jgi:pimeloyl-ACP methyl ester carboxylesterase
MNLNDTTSTTPNTSHLVRPEGRIGYDVAGTGPLLVLVPGMGDLRAGYRFLAPALRAAGYRVACTDLRGHGDSDATLGSYGDTETAGDIVALITELGGTAVVVGNSMSAGSAVIAAARRPGLVSGLVLVGPFVRDPAVSLVRRIVLRAAVASLGRPGYARAFSLTTRTSHAPAEVVLGQVAVPVLVIMGERDPDFGDPAAEAAWIAQATGGQVVTVPDAGHYPQSQQPVITTDAVLRFLATVYS